MWLHFFAPRADEECELPNPVPVLVAQAKCKHRLNDLRQDLNEAKQFNDRARAVKAQREMECSQQQISDVQVGNGGRQSILVGESLQITARVHLGTVDPQHVRVEAYYGEVDNGDICNRSATLLNQSGRADGRRQLYLPGSSPRI